MKQEGEGQTWLPCRRQMTRRTGAMLSGLVLKCPERPLQHKHVSGPGQDIVRDEKGKRPVGTWEHNSAGACWRYEGIGWHVCTLQTLLLPVPHGIKRGILRVKFQSPRIIAVEHARAEMRKPFLVLEHSEAAGCRGRRGPGGHGRITPQRGGGDPPVASQQRDRWRALHL
jgi:hypothetical protein